MKSKIEIVPMALDSMFKSVLPPGTTTREHFELFVTTTEDDGKNSTTINFPLFSVGEDAAVVNKINFALDNTRAKLQYYLNQNKEKK